MPLSSWVLKGRYMLMLVVGMTRRARLSYAVNLVTRFEFESRLYFIILSRQLRLFSF